MDYHQLLKLSSTGWVRVSSHFQWNSGVRFATAQCRARRHLGASMSITSRTTSYPPSLSPDLAQNYTPGLQVMISVRQ
jgi:hypothetical protein